MMNGAILANNIGLFYIFSEMIVVPLFMIFTIFQNLKKDMYDPFKFLICAICSSTLFLVAIAYLRSINLNVEPVYSLDLDNLYNLNLSFKQQLFIFFILLLSFGSKILVFPFHTWLRDLCFRTPGMICIFLMAIFLNLGILGMVRFLLPLSTQVCMFFNKPIIIILLLSIIYNGMIAYVQSDFRKLIGYISTIKVNLIALGIFVALPLISQDPQLANLCLSSIVMQILSHCWIMSGLYIVIVLLSQYFQVNNLKSIQDIFSCNKVIAGFLLLLCLATVGFPGTSSFISDFIIVLGSFKLNFWLGLVVACSMAISFSCMMFKSSNLNFSVNTESFSKILVTLHNKEFIPLGIINFFIVLSGIYPEVWLKILKNSINDFILILGSKL